MELKFPVMARGSDNAFSFNRTFMELKYVKVVLQSRERLCVLIVPLWN